MRKINNLLIKKISIILFILTVSFQAYSQSIISQDIADYPSGTTFSNCPGGSCTITLPKAKLNQMYEITIPINGALPVDSFNISNVGGCTEILNNYSISNTDNTINLQVTQRCPIAVSSNLSFILNAYYNSNIEPQPFIVPIIRDTAKLVLTLDISESMSLPVQGGSGTRIDALKDAVNMLVPKLVDFGQEGDSLSLTYFSSTVIKDSHISKSFNAVEASPTSIEDTVTDDLMPRIPLQMSVLGEGLLNAKEKLDKDNSNGLKRIVFLFSDGLQDYGNLLQLDGISFTNSTDSLNNYSSNPKDSIIYITVTTTKAADVPPIMAAIAHKNKGVSLHVDGSALEFLIFTNTQLANILEGEKPVEVATRICGLSPYDDSTNIQLDTDLTIDFNEDVAANTGDIVIYRTSDDSEFETVDVTSGKISGNNTSTITISLENEFESEIEYYVLIDENAVKGTSGNDFAGIISKTYWNFTTEDVDSPTVEISTENETVTESQFDIEITFSEEVTGFEQSDIILTNGSVQSLSSTDDIVFTSEIQAIDEGALTISVGADAAEDLSGNLSESSNLLTVTYNSTTGINDLNNKEVKIYSSKGNVIVELVNIELNTLQNAYAEVYSLNGSLITKKEINEDYTKLNINKDIKYGIVKVVIDGKLYSNEVLINQ